MVRVFVMILLLAGCMAAPQKSLPPTGQLGAFRSAFAEVGDDAAARSVAHIVAVEGQHGLVVYVRRKDGQAARVSRATIGGRTVASQRVTVADGVEGAMIPHSEADMAQAARNGVEADLCGPLDCYQIKVPAALYQQALLE